MHPSPKLRVQSGRFHKKLIWLIPFFCLALATFFWAASFIAARGVRDAITPIELAFSRWVLAAAVVTIIGFPTIKKQWHLLLRNWKNIVILGATGIAGYCLLLYKALSHTTAINAAILMSLVPMLILIISWMFYKKKIRTGQFIGILVSSVGALAILTKGQFYMLGSLEFNVGDLWMLLSLPVWAVYTITIQRLPKEILPVTKLAGSVYAGVLMLLPMQLYQIAIGNPLTINHDNFWAICYIGLFASVFAFFLWTRGVSEIGASRAGIFIHLIPVFTAILSIVVLGEAFYLFHGFGIGLVFTGVYLTNRKPKEKPATDLDTFPQLQGELSPVAVRGNLTAVPDQFKKV